VLVRHSGSGKDQTCVTTASCSDHGCAFVPDHKLQDIQPQDRTDILSQVLTTAASSSSTAFVGELSELEYCVQYRESDFAFMSRLWRNMNLLLLEHDEIRSQAHSGGFEFAHEHKARRSGARIPRVAWATLSARTD